MIVGEYRVSSRKQIWIVKPAIRVLNQRVEGKDICRRLPHCIRDVPIDRPCCETCDKPGPKIDTCAPPNECGPFWLGRGDQLHKGRFNVYQGWLRSLNFEIRREAGAHKFTYETRFCGFNTSPQFEDKFANP